MSVAREWLVMSLMFGSVAIVGAAWAVFLWGDGDMRVDLFVIAGVLLLLGALGGYRGAVAELPRLARWVPVASVAALFAGIVATSEPVVTSIPPVVLWPLFAAGALGYLFLAAVTFGIQLSTIRRRRSARSFAPER